MDAAAVQLPEPDIARAKELLSSYPRRSYWYSPEFESPNAVLSNTKGEMTFIYRLLSGSVHGGTVGLGFLDDNPDEFDINARNHPRRSPLAIALSSRLLLETTFLRDSGEETEQTAKYYYIKDKVFLPLKDVIAGAAPNL